MVDWTKKKSTQRILSAIVALASCDLRRSDWIHKARKIPTTTGVIAVNSRVSREEVVARGILNFYSSRGCKKFLFRFPVEPLFRPDSKGDVTQPSDHAEIKPRQTRDLLTIPLKILWNMNESGVFCRNGPRRLYLTKNGNRSETLGTRLSFQWHRRSHNGKRRAGRIISCIVGAASFPGCAALSTYADFWCCISYGFAHWIDCVFNSPSPFDTEQSWYKLFNQLLDRLFATYVAKNVADATDNMKWKSISEKVIDECNGTVKNVRYNSVILSDITQALSQIQLQFSHE